MPLVVTRVGKVLAICGGGLLFCQDWHALLQWGMCVLETHLALRQRHGLPSFSHLQSDGVRDSVDLKVLLWLKCLSLSSW